MTEFGLAVYGALCAVAAGPTQTGPLTIDQAVSIAESRAFAVRLQQSGLLRSNAVVKQAEAGLGPQFNVGGSISRAGQGNFTTFNGQTTNFSPLNSTTAQLQLSLPLDFSGGLHAQLNSAEANRRAQAQTVQASLNDARLNARTAFLNVLRAKATLEVQSQSLRNAETQALQAHQQLEQVQVAKIDVDRLDAQVAQRRSDLIDAQNALELANYQLNLTLARPIETPVDAVDIPVLPDLDPEPNALDRTARTSRPETQAARERLNAFAYIRKAAERAGIPNVNLAITQQRALGDIGFGGQRNATTLGLTFSVPVFDSGLIRSRVGQARQDEVQAQINLEQTELSVSQEVRAAVTNYRNAKARLDNAVRQVELAQEVFRIAQVRQAAGAGTYVEVVDAETTLTTARNGLVRARYDILTAYSQLQRAVGDDRLAGPTTPAAGGTGAASK